MITQGGLDPQTSESIGLCVESKCNYFSSLEFPDLVEAGLFVSHKGKTSVKYEVGIFKQGSEHPSAHGHFVHVFVDAKSRKPAAFSSKLDSALSDILVSENF